MIVENPLVSVVDDDESVRESLPDLIKQFGHRVKAFSSAEEYLVSDDIRETKCLLVDVGMPGMTGPQLLQELQRLGRSVPIVFITAQRDDAMRRRLIELGAVECLFKPFSDIELENALNLALPLR